MSKICGRCKTKKATSEFNVRNSAKDGLNPWCKVCNRAYEREQYNRNPTNKRRIAKESRARNPDMSRSSNLKQKFGITLVEYEAMLDLQNGWCAVCNQSCKTGKRLAVDHNHTTGQIRGLLCANCNTALGKLGDSVDTVRNLLYYIEKWGS